jgi:hypothetical protein
VTVACAILSAPQISAAQKNVVIGKAFSGKLPTTWSAFSRNSSESPADAAAAVAIEYGNLVDEHNRVTRR